MKKPEWEQTYWKREMLRAHEKTEQAGPNFIRRKPNIKEILSHYGWQLLRIILTPFYYLFWVFPRWVIRLFYDNIRIGDNGIIGPGYHVRYTTKFSWGKLSFVLVVLFIITYLILLR